MIAHATPRAANDRTSMTALNPKQTTEALMRTLKATLLAVTTVVVLSTTTPAFADFCIQLNGGSFSGDLGFFLFKGLRPTTNGAVVDLKGRVAGLSPVFGAATVAKDGSFLEIGATFFADGDQGQIDVTFFPKTGTTGTFGGAFNAYGTSGSTGTATVVNCNLEP
jgi:hypothetical protein